MPWTTDQTRVLRELGVAWLRPGGVPVVAAEPRRSGEAEVLATPVSPSPSPSPSLPSPAEASLTMAPRVPLAHGIGWAELAEQVRQCRACTLCETRRQTVFGVGSSQAHWMIVGEAPGEQEDLQGEPFVGAAGRLLDQMLRPLGLSRGAQPDGALPPGSREVYIANTLKCRPPGNRNPQVDELDRCEPFLQRQLELLQPRIIVAMGRFAIQQLLRSDDAVGKLRGRVHRYGGVPLVVTYHPAYLLRNPLDKAKAWADWCLAAHTYRGGPHG
ncbi:MAG: uracil-DNA glycosylase [Rubrivivax sp.]|jgi:DNA polymerase